MGEAMKDRQAISRGVRRAGRAGMSLRREAALHREALDRMSGGTSWPVIHIVDAP